jgi:hypothetical protein
VRNAHWIVAHRQSGVVDKRCDVARRSHVVSNALDILCLGDIAHHDVATGLGRKLL